MLSPFRPRDPKSPILLMAVSPSCSVGGWSTTIPICMNTCPSLGQPANVGSCTKTVLSHDFADTTPLLFYDADPNIPAVVFSSFWSISNGVLNTGVGSSSQSIIKPSPNWAYYIADSQWAQMSFVANVTSG